MHTPRRTPWHENTPGAGFKPAPGAAGEGAGKLTREACPTIYEKPPSPYQGDTLTGAGGRGEGGSPSPYQGDTLTGAGGRGEGGNRRAQAN